MPSNPPDDSLPDQSSSGTSVHAAARLLETRIAKGDPGAGERMPGSRDIAARWRLSPVTVLQALRMLLAKGLLEKRGEKSRYFVMAERPRADHPLPRREPRSRSIAAELAQELLVRGLEKGYAVPTAKEIRHRFGCSHPTAASALAILRQQGWVSRQGRGFIVRRSEFRPAPLTRVHIIGSPFIASGLSGELSAFTQAVRQELVKLDWGEPAFFLSNHPLNDPLAPEDHEVSAYIFMRRHVSKGWGMYLRRKRKIPLIYISMEESRAGDYSRFPHYYRILPGNAHAGAAVGRHLRELGHRRIAFFTHLEVGPGWSANRLRGLADAFPLANAGIGIPSITVHRIRSPGREVKNDAVERLRKAGGELRGAAWLPPAVAHSQASLLVRLAEQAGLADRAWPVFESAWRNDPATAWVCVNDELAVLARRFLESQGIGVPQRVSVAGFDNSPAAALAGITSFDFDLASIGVSSVACLARTGLNGSIASDPLRCITIDGYLAHRNSTAKPYSR